MNPRTRTLALVLAALASLAMARVAPAQSSEAAPLWETPFFRFFAPPELAGSAGFYREELEAARRRARENWTRPLNSQVDVYVWTGKAWEALAQQDPAMRDVLAFVRGSDQSLVINHVGCRMADPGEFRRTLVHEYTHIYLGRMMAEWPPGAERRRLPRWLEEGLAMAAAGQIPWWDTALLDWQGPNRMIPLMNLADSFPDNPAGQRQAYREAAGAVGFLIHERGGVRNVIDEIVDPVKGPEFVARTWTPSVIAGFEQRWHATLRIGWRWMLVFTTAGFLWAVVIVLAAVAWLRRRQRDRRKVARWALEAEGLIPGGLSDEEQDEAVRRLLNRES